MSHLTIKICGVTRAEDAELAVVLGADAIGVIFAKSKAVAANSRTVNTSQANRIFHALMGHRIARVGVFTAASLAEICATANAVSLTAIQLHDPATFAFARELQGRGYDVIKVAVVDNTFSAMNADDQTRDGATLLLDTSKSASSGIVTHLDRLRRQRPQRPFSVAGKLTATNVREVISQLRPVGVDVASGVELRPGIKCPQRLTEFFRAARGASCSTIEI